jgi:hypothetical protein
MRYATLIAGACALLSACAGKPLQPFSLDTEPLILVPASAAGVVDQRPRFREIFCSVLAEHGPALPDYRPCDEALTRLGAESAGTGAPVYLGPSKRNLVAMIVPGIGYDCFAPWLETPGTTAIHLRTQGYDAEAIRVDALSGSAHNAQQIRDALLALPQGEGAPKIVLVGYSKGAPDIMEALASYPEIRGRVAAFVSAAGAVGGSALANDATESQVNMLQHFPGAKCEPGDGKSIESLQPAARRKWLGEHLTPPGIPYYSLVTLPQPERISRVLGSSYKKLSRVDGRNDSQVIFYDQVIPGSTLLGYVNADHWALAVPIARVHTTVGSLLATQNHYPREALLEAILRFVEEDLDAHPSGVVAPVKQ